MAIQLINNGETLLSVRNKINANFSELYNSSLDTSFASLSDTPDVLTPGLFLRVNSAGDAIELDSPLSDVKTSDLSDIILDAAITDGDILVWNSSAGNWQSATPSTATGATSFEQLIDTSSDDLSANANNFLQVDSFGASIEYVNLTTDKITDFDSAVDAATSSVMLSGLNDTYLTGPMKPADGQALVWSDAFNIWVPGDVVRGTGEDATAGNAIFFLQFSSLNDTTNLINVIDNEPVNFNAGTGTEMSWNEDVLLFDQGAFKFNESLGEYLYYNSQDLSILSTQNMTIEFWANVIPNGTGNVVLFNHHTTTVQDGEYQVRFTDDHIKVIFGGKTYTYTFISDWAETWVHYAVVNLNETVSVFANGTRLTAVSETVGAEASWNNPAGRLNVGGFGGNNYSFNGYLQNILITKEALYTGNFSAPGELLAINDIMKAEIKFTTLSDTPDTLVANKYVKVNAAGDALEFQDASTSFQSLSDTPDTLAADKYVKVNAAGDALEFVDVSTTFQDLTDTPEVLQAGNYLRVNRDGTGVEQVRTAPPDGGIGDNSAVQAACQFDGKLPDVIFIDRDPNGFRSFIFSAINTTSITYQYWTEEDAGESYYVNFDLEGKNMVKAGKLATQTGWNTRGYTTIQQFIDAGLTVSHGQKSGTSGVGSLSYVKKLHTGFYTELPDAIIIQETDSDTGNTWDAVAKLSYIHHGGYLIDYRSDANYRIRFDTTNDSDGLVEPVNPSNLIATHTLRWYVENGRALYYGSNPTVSQIGKLEPVSSITPLASIVDIPDAILQQDVNGIERVLLVEKIDVDHIQYKLLLGGSISNRMKLRFSNTTGDLIDSEHVNNTTLSNIRDYISEDRVLYFGGSGGGSSEFTKLIDTPDTLVANKYVRVNSTGDALELGDVSTTFLDLTDTPDTLLAGKYLQVNSSGDALQLTDCQFE